MLCGSWLKKDLKSACKKDSTGGELQLRRYEEMVEEVSKSGRRYKTATKTVRMDMWKWVCCPVDLGRHVSGCQCVFGKCMVCVRYGATEAVCTGVWCVWICFPTGLCSVWCKSAYSPNASQRVKPHKIHIVLRLPKQCKRSNHAKDLKNITSNCVKQSINREDKYL